MKFNDHLLMLSANNSQVSAFKLTWPNDNRISAEAKLATPLPLNNKQGLP
jgi:hypothetical protein